MIKLTGISIKIAKPVINKANIFGWSSKDNGSRKYVLNTLKAKVTCKAIKMIEFFPT